MPKYLAAQINGNVARAFYEASEEIFKKAQPLIDYLNNIKLEFGKINVEHTDLIGKMFKITRPRRITRTDEDFYLGDVNKPEGLEWRKMHGFADWEGNPNELPAGFTKRGGALTNVMGELNEEEISAESISQKEYIDYIVNVRRINKVESIDSIIDFIGTMFNEDAFKVFFDTNTGVGDIIVEMHYSLRDTAAFLQAEFDKVFTTSPKVTIQFNNG